jgi:hypothetical protein
MHFLSNRSAQPKSSQRIYLKGSASFKEWWLGRESNPRHEDFQSSALPTELPSRFGRGERIAQGIRIDKRDGGKCPRHSRVAERELS